jgi:hypothetical protein
MYKTQREYCPCCNQKLPNPKTSDYKEFMFTKESAQEWCDAWGDIAKYDDIHSTIEDFVSETISFFAMNSSDRLLIEDSEFNKVKEFVQKEVIDNIN